MKKIKKLMLWSLMVGMCLPNLLQADSKSITFNNMTHEEICDFMSKSDPEMPFFDALRKFAKTPECMGIILKGVLSVGFLVTLNYLVSHRNVLPINFPVIYPGDIDVTFDDIAGLESVKAYMQNIINYMQNAKKAMEIGTKMPKGVLMYGPPGNGKTLFARAVAGEIGCPFISVAGSSFVQMYVGMGAARVRELFAQARTVAHQAESKKCIIFIDEFDALAPKRSSDNSSAPQEYNQTINALLAEMDGLEKDNSINILVIAATNRLDSLDRAVIRSGRFDFKVEIGKPNTQDRIELLKINFKKVAHDENLDLDLIAAMTSGFSCAEIENLINEAAFLAFRDNCDFIGMKEIEEACFVIKENRIQTVDASFEIDILYPGDMKVTFDDVAGLVGAKAEMQDIINYLKNPTKYVAIGAKYVKGILMNGPTGNGKTLLARAVAGQAGVPFLSVAGSSFANKWVGSGEERVRELFKKARQQAPCIIFIDEIDAFLGNRDLNQNNDSQYTKMVNVFLTEMDGLIESKIPVIIIGATNRVESLDPAAIRPGRFDRVVEINKPFIKDRVELLQIALKKVKSQDIDVQTIAVATRGFSGAQLANLMNEAAYVAVNDDSDVILMRHIEIAMDNITLGRINKSIEQTKQALWETAIHEAGHVIGFVFQDKTVVAHKVSIEPRARSLGVAHWLPLYESYSPTQDSMKNSIITLLSGRFAEEEFGLGLSSGASDDIERAQQIAYDMVVIYGMSPDLPDISYSKFIDKLPNDILTRVHNAANKIIQECRQVARKLIAEHKNDIEKLAQLLMEKGTVMGSEIYQVLNIEMPSIIDQNVFA